MKSFFKLLILSLLVFLASCSKTLEPSGLSDAEIIQLIHESDLMDVESDLMSFHWGPWKASAVLF